MACRRLWIAAAVVFLVLFGALPVRAGTNGVEEGRNYYTRYCAACHGRAADGHGPVAPVLRDPPTDLRRLGERYGRPLPLDQIARFIDGTAPVVAHGNREMPVWGERFVEVDAEGNVRDSGMRVKIAKIVTFLSSIQITSEP
jgi:mono/diheme cytochrome c family protein